MDSLLKMTLVNAHTQVTDDVNLIVILVISCMINRFLSFHTGIGVDFNLAVTSPVDEGSPSDVTLTPTTALPRQVVITVTLQTGSAQGMNLPLSIDTTDQNQRVEYFFLLRSSHTNTRVYILFFIASDFDSSALTFTFSSGQTDPMSQVIATTEDLLVELEETFSVIASSADSNVMITPSSETVTIMDDDRKM